MINLTVSAAMKKNPEAQYQHYQSARVAMRLITDKGKPIIFTGFEFLTQDKAIIEYLDNEIAEGMTSIVKGSLVTLDDRDPMAAMKRKWQKEYDEKLAKEAGDKARGISQDMGSTEGNKTKQLGALSTKGVAN